MGKDERESQVRYDGYNGYTGYNGGMMEYDGGGGKWRRVEEGNKTIRRELRITTR